MAPPMGMDTSMPRLETVERPIRLVGEEEEVEVGLDVVHEAVVA
jgi:hypothetical protein